MYASQRLSQRHYQGRSQHGEASARRVIRFMHRGPSTMSPTCEHAERRCTKRSRLGLCCACSDIRPIEPDGQGGWAYDATRWAAYCASCQEVESKRASCKPAVWAPGACEHWAARGCLMPTGLGLCCSCLNGCYPVYVDGEGWVYEETPPLATAFYCQVCKNVKEGNAVEAEKTEAVVEIAEEAMTDEKDVTEGEKQEAMQEEKEVVGGKEENEEKNKEEESVEKIEEGKDEEKEERDELKTYVENLAQQIVERPNPPADQPDELETMPGFEVVAVADIDVELSLPAAQPKKGGGWLG